MRVFGKHHHGCDDPYDGAPAFAIELREILLFIVQQQETIMTATDDLKAAIADLTTQLSDNNAEIEALLGKITAPGASDADVAAATQSIRDLITANKAEVDKAKAAVA